MDIQHFDNEYKHARRVGWKLSSEVRMICDRVRELCGFFACGRTNSISDRGQFEWKGKTLSSTIHATTHRFYKDQNCRVGVR